MAVGFLHFSLKVDINFYEHQKVLIVVLQLLFSLLSVLFDLDESNDSVIPTLMFFDSFTSDCLFYYKEQLASY